MLGMFPMSESRKNKKFFFVDPEFRAVIPIFKFHISKSLLRLVKKKPFEITINKVFSNTVNETGGVGRVVPGINTTVDVGPNEIIKQAKKFGNDVNKDGFPKKLLRTKKK